MDVNGQAQNDMHTLAQGRALAEQHELESEIVEEHESESDIEEHELRSELTEEHELETESPDQNELQAELRKAQGLVSGGLGIADVLFPASPPAPVNARVIKLFSAEDEKKPRGLASAAGLFGVSRSNPYDWRS